MVTALKRIALLAGVVALLAACGPSEDSGGGTHGYGSITAHAVWPGDSGPLATLGLGNVHPLDTPAGVFSIVATVSGPDMSPVLATFNTTPFASGVAASGTIGNVPAGAGRTLTLEGYTGSDGGGTVVYRGVVSNISVQARQSTDAGPVTMSNLVVLQPLAGHFGGPGNADGTGTSARFYQPVSLATDSLDNIYVADSLNHVIRKITSAGVSSTLAGSAGLSGSGDGTGSAARFNFPYGVGTDGSDNIYVADGGNHTIRKITPAGVVTTVAGLAGTPGSDDGTGSAARFNIPTGVASDSAGNIYVADFQNHTIRMIDTGGAVTTLAGLAGTSGTADNTGPAARFFNPRSIATDSLDTLYVADSGNHAIRIVAAGGVVTTFAGLAGASGTSDGTGTVARFYLPQGVATDSNDNVYVADRTNFTVRKITPAGAVTTYAGSPQLSGDADGNGTGARFRLPYGIAADSSNNVYVADYTSHTIRKIAPNQDVTTFAGLPQTPGTNDDTGALARFNAPWSIAPDSAGNLYVADTLNHTIRKITPAGVVTTFAGLPGSSGPADGSGTSAKFSSPMGVATDVDDNVYVADTGNYTVRKISPEGDVTTVAGLAGTSGSIDGDNLTATLGYPTSIAADSAGNLYVTEYFSYTIRKITPTGVVSTLAGSAGVSGTADATGPSARFLGPYGIASDGAGNLFVAERGNHAIRKVTSAGVVTTVAGLKGSSGSADGTGTGARFSSPYNIACDGTGNLYVADTDNHTVRKIEPGGVVTTIVGIAGEQGYTPGVLPGRIGSPRGVAVSGTALYIAIYHGVAVVPSKP
jgi:sugar lactone lactonase YvrE